MHPIEQQIHRADKAIMAEDFDTLINIYTEDAVLVVKPGMNAVGRASIRKAFEAIVAYFDHSISVQQAGMIILETGNTALVLAKTLVSASNLPVIERKATYVFNRLDSGDWLCSIDNSYGHDLLNSPDA
ncbi:YybH family protein [Comamonas sp. J-3]|uniref:YybH family protein n=1 Tax=Comamonas trifloxystrobinivorans TaxID=3350256 RepID=UPI003727C332